MTIKLDFSGGANTSDGVLALALAHALLNRASDNPYGVLRQALDSLKASNNVTIAEARRRLEAMLDQTE